MPQTRSAKKRLRQTEKRTERNKAYKSRIKTAIRKFRLAATEGRAEDARLSYREATSLLDKAVEKGILHKNNAGRRKSRMTLQVNKLEG
ncbi:MAG: 30S ribosomal protein S20 [bacterium]|nr:30S ribosomal protein S20 [bacterium]